jgi:quercetin dioxygenase-like cupin family protein
MRIGNVDEVPREQVSMEGAEGVWIRVVIGPAQGAPNFVMRVFDVEPGGHTPFHRHAFEHEVYVLAGEGVLVEEGREARLAPGDVVLVAPDAVHQFRAAGGEAFRFLCLVPKV